MQINNRKSPGQQFVQTITLKNGKTKRVLHYRDSSLKMQIAHFDFMEKHFRV